MGLLTDVQMVAAGKGVYRSSIGPYTSTSYENIVWRDLYKILIQYKFESLSNRFLIWLIDYFFVNYSSKCFFFFFMPSLCILLATWLVDYFFVNCFSKYVFFFMSSLCTLLATCCVVCYDFCVKTMLGSYLLIFALQGFIYY